MLVVADTSPLNYLVLIKQIEILPRLFSQVLVPGAVRDELSHDGTPADVRAWASAPPGWVHVRNPMASPIALDRRLGAGEREAILLSLELRADLILVDESLGRAEAHRHHLSIIGIFGILKRTHLKGLLDLEESLNLLQQTSFWAHPSIFDALRASVKE